MIEPLITPLLILSGFLLLYFGGETLLKGSTALAVKAGISPLIIGLTVVAFGTSSPELAVGIQAALKNEGGLVVGNVVGSNICNIALILGLSAFIKPLTTARRGVLSQAPILVAISLLMCLLLVDNAIARWEGLLLTTGIGGYLIYQFYQHKKYGQTDLEIDEDEIKETAKSTNSIWTSILLVVVGLVLLNGGGFCLIEGAERMAFSLGVPEAVIGLTVVALGTSIPELAICLLAIIRNQEEISIGTILGSNIFNILAILGISASVQSLQVPDINMYDLIVMTLITILIFPLMRTKWSLERWEGGLLLAIYSCYITYLFTIS